jgi:surface lipoprotein assembly modifier-like protein
VQLAYPFAPGWKLNVVGTGILKKNQDFSEFDTTTGTLQTGISLKTKSSLYNLDLVAQEFLLDTQSYRSLTGANAGWVYHATEQSSFNASFQFARLSYKTYSILDSDLMTLNLGYSKEFTASLAPVFFTNAKLGNENAKSDSAGAKANTSRDIYSLRLGMALSFSSRFILQAALGSQGSRYKDKQITEPVGIKRKDTYNTADLSLFWLLNKDWRIDTRIAYSQNTSNVPIREYDRLLASFNVNYNF